MEIINLTVNSKIKITSKPDKSDIGRISAGLNTKADLYNGVASFVKMLNAQIAYCPAVFNGGRSNDNWVSQQIFALDFDNGFTPEEAIDRLDLYSLSAQVIYTTFSDTPEKRKFRLVFILDTNITKKDTRDWIVTKLLGLFPEADKAVKDAARLFYPGKEITNIDLEYTKLNDLVEVLMDVEVKNYEYAEITNNLPFSVTAEQSTDEVLRMVNNYMNKKGIYFMKGSRHLHNITFASMCNHFGVSKYDCVNELYRTGCASEYTEGRVNDIYRRYSNQHNIKQLNKSYSYAS
jgi:hypothetical protein